MEICYKNESKFKGTRCLCFVFRLIWAWHEIKPYDWICSNFKELWYYRLWKEKLKCSSIWSISSCWYSGSTLVVKIQISLFMPTFWVPQCSQGVLANVLNLSQFPTFQHPRVNAWHTKRALIPDCVGRYIPCTNG